MLTSSSFHPVRTDLAKNAIKATLQAFTTTTVDAAQVREFIAELRSCKKISTGRANKFTFTLIAWRRFIGPFPDNTLADRYAAIPERKIAKSSREKSSRERPFRQNKGNEW